MKLFDPRTFTDFRVDVSVFGKPVVFPYDVTKERKERLLTLILKGLEDEKPKLIWMKPNELNSLVKNDGRLGNVSIPQNSLLYIPIKSRREWKDVVEAQRYLKALGIIVDVRSPSVVGYRKWLSELNVWVVNALRTMINKEKIFPQKEVKFPFDFCLKTFESPLDVIDFANHFSEEIAGGKSSNIAKKEAAQRLILDYLKDCEVEELKVLAYLLMGSDMDGIARDLSLKKKEVKAVLDNLHKKGIVRIYEGKIYLQTIFEQLKEPNMLERTIRKLEIKLPKDVFESVSDVYYKALSAFRGPVRPVGMIQQASIEAHAYTPLFEEIKVDELKKAIQVYLSKIGSDELNAVSLDASLDELVEFSNNILVKEMNPIIRAGCLVLRAFAKLQKGEIKSSERDLLNAEKNDEKVKILTACFYLISADSFARKGSTDLALEQLDKVSERIKFLPTVVKIKWGIGLGDILYDLCKFKDAEERYNEHLELIKSSKMDEKQKREEIARIKHKQGIIHQKLGDYPKAKRIYEENLKVFEELGDKKGIAATLHQIGMIHQDQGNYLEAKKLYKESLEIEKELGDKSGIASTLHQLGVIQHNQGNYSEALKLYEESLKIDKELNDKHGIAYTLGQLGNINLDQGEYKKAFEKYKQALKTFKELGDKENVAITLHNIGMIQHNQGNYLEAKKLYKESLEIKEELGDKKGIAGTLHNLGIIQQGQGNYSEALKLYEESLKIDKELGDKFGIAIGLGQIGRIYQTRKWYRKAVRNYLRAASIFHELKSPYEKLALKDLSNVKEKVGEKRFNSYMKEVES